MSEGTRVKSARVRRASLGTHYLEDLHTYRVDRENFIIHLAADPAHAGSGHLEPGEEPGVEHSMADRFEINMGILREINSERNILVMLSSDGGNLVHGLKIFSAIAYSPNPVTVLATYDATSATSFIPLAADRFVMRPPARYMIHKGQYSVSGTQELVTTYEKERVRSLTRMLDIYVSRLHAQGKFHRWGRKKIAQLLLRRMEQSLDMWLSARQAVQEGFADDVFDGDWGALRQVDVNVPRRDLVKAILDREYPIPQMPPLEEILEQSPLRSGAAGPR